MARQEGRPGAKETALAAARCLNPHPEQVRDTEFLSSEFFDARDMVQVKYEMVRKVKAEGAPVTAAAAAFGYSRPSYYEAAAALERSGLEGLVPARPGPRGSAQADRGDPRLGRAPAGRRSRAAPGALAGPIAAEPSACACTPAPSSERWPAAGSTPKDDMHRPRQGPLAAELAGLGPGRGDLPSSGASRLTRRHSRAGRVCAPGA